MSKFGCTCGHIICTTVFPNLIEGTLYGDAAADEFRTESEAAIGSYFRAKAAGERSRWLEENFATVYPQDTSDEEVISDLILRIQLPYLRDVLECPSCGRLNIQEKPGLNEYRSYLPEGAKFGVFKKDKDI